MITNNPIFYRDKTFDDVIETISAMNAVVDRLYQAAQKLTQNPIYYKPFKKDLTHDTCEHVNLTRVNNIKLLLIGLEKLFCDLVISHCLLGLGGDR